MYGFPYLIHTIKPPIYTRGLTSHLKIKLSVINTLNILHFLKNYFTVYIQLMYMYQKCYNTKSVQGVKQKRSSLLATIIWTAICFVLHVFFLFSCLLWIEAGWRALDNLSLYFISSKLYIKILSLKIYLIMVFVFSWWSILPQINQFLYSVQVSKRIHGKLWSILDR